MKYKFGKYPTRLVCHIHSNYMNDKYDHRWHTNQTRFEAFLERLEDAIQWVYNIANKLWFDKRKQYIKLRLDDHDIWSFDYTLAHIVLPALKLLKEKKHGSPFVDFDDVPEHLRPSEEEMRIFQEDGLTDKYFNKRWEWVLDEMIWAFEQIVTDDDDYMGSPDYNHDDWIKRDMRIQNGTRLFGKYLRSLWD